MIKIIKPGKYINTAICPLCECVFSYENEDIKKGDLHKEVECPCCKTYIDLTKQR